MRGHVRPLLAAAAWLLAVAVPGHGFAQSTADPTALARMSDGELVKLPAKQVFGAQKQPTADLKARAIGTYAKGCMAGGKAIAVDGPAWQVMRLSRNRNWGHPNLVALVERLAVEAKEKDGWNGLLVGDLAQPRGGPMLSGHASHQLGLDADVWLTPMPNRTLSRKEREEIQATVVVKDRKTINPKVWTEAHARLLKRAASYPEVARIFVHPPIKAEMCKWAGGKGEWLAKIRPYFGHNYHFHIRIRCPEGSPDCRNQGDPQPKDGTGCGDELAYWLGDKPWPRPAKPEAKPAKPSKPAPPLTLAALPAECRTVVTAE